MFHSPAWTVNYALLVVTALLLGSTPAHASLRKLKGECFCNSVYDPVCSTDGKEFSNKCEAECAGAKVDYTGSCRQGCFCASVYDPVCSTDGKEFSNKCEAECAGAKVDYTGSCRQGCFCNSVYDPVCTTDGKEYSNKCEAECAGAKVDYTGSCKKDTGKKLKGEGERCDKSAECASGCCKDCWFCKDTCVIPERSTKCEK
eukprot:gene28455-31601_t